MDIAGNETTTGLPLEGLRVLDTTDSSGWSAGRLLADLGADVVFAGAATDFDEAAFARSLNKRRMVASGDELLAVTKHFDVWLDTAGNRVDIAAARQENPGLIVVTISPFGTTGPYAGRVASDPVLLAMSGILHRARPPGGQPLLPPGRMASEAAGAMAAYLALVSVWRRATTG
ncbi:MAG TPA: CoA transferase, partial [Acidimicrobiia bacterium]